MTEIAIRYHKGGVDLITDGLTDEDRDTVQSMFDEGCRDPGEMRREIGQS